MMKFATCNGITLHYADTDPGASDTRPVIVFVNSLGTDFRIWDDVVANLSETYRCIQYDKRGHGLSDAPQLPYVIGDHVGDLIALMDHCGVRTATVCGVSVGGLIAQGIAAERPERAIALVLCDTGAKIGDDVLWNARIEAAMEAASLEPLADAVMERWFPAAWREANPQALSVYRNMMSRTPFDGYVGTCHAIRDADFRETSRAVSVPTTVICGAEDKATPPSLNRALAELIPDATYAELPGVGHLPSLQMPDQVAELIRGVAGQSA